MEIFGLVLGTTGLIALADKALLLAQILNDIRGFGKDTAELIFQLSNESQKTYAWTLEAAKYVDPPSGRELADFQGEMFNNVKRNVDTSITRLLLAIEEADTILRKYGLNEPVTQPATKDKTVTAGIASSLAVIGMNPSRLRLRSILEQKQREAYIGQKLSVQKKAKFLVKPWGKPDRDKLADIISRLKYWNGELWSLLSSQQQQTLTFQVNCQIMSVVSDDETLSVVELAAASESSEDLAASAGLSRKRIEAEQDNVENERFQVPWARCNFLRSGDDATEFVKVSIADSDGTTQIEYDAYLDWVRYGQLDAEQKDIATSRVGILCELLNFEKKPKTLRTLSCVGYVDDSVRNRYGLLLKLPSIPASIPGGIPIVVSLAGILGNNILQTKPLGNKVANPRPSLAQRFQLARRLAVSFMELHNARWLHKGFNSAKIIFYSTDLTEITSQKAAEFKAKITFEEPFITGFEFARPSGSGNISLPISPQAGADIYWHPQLRRGLRDGRTGALVSLPRYRRAYDIYSLSLVLLEIGLWQPLTQFYKPDLTVSKLHSRFVAIAEQNLTHTMGEEYKNAVVAGLTWLGMSFDENGDVVNKDEEDENAPAELQKLFWDVVRRLEKCACGVKDD